MRGLRFWAASANTSMPDEAFQLIEWFGTKDMQQKQADLGVTMAAYEGMSEGWVNSVDCFNAICTCRQKWQMKKMWKAVSN